MGLFTRIFGICETRLPGNGRSWEYSGNTVDIDLKQVPELLKPGGAIRLEGNGLPERLLVVHGNDDRFYAFRNRCTHRGRRVDPIAGTALICCCSVSRSAFDYSGSVACGPADGPLKSYKTEAEGDTLTLSLD
ncbi:Rieske (2Fe-2S) protein [Thermodesulfobacteriota bacterium]